ncbi:hypothetical protein [Plantibacter sp. YIM 135249]|uniref:hypothetical protein n=1 Tax=Plantibacter sp. YIM 135249 TaxID=3423918 RepID=UPI003D33FA8D
MAVSPVAQDVGPYWVGDVPMRPIPVEFVDEYNELTDPPAEALTAELRDAQRGIVAQLMVERTPGTDGEPEEVVIKWTGTPAFATPGVWSILMRAGGDRLRPLRFVVEHEDGWVSIEQAREDWTDAPSSDAQVFVLLESAKLSCIPYAPALPAGAPVPANYVQAQLMHARNIWNSTRSDPGDQIGTDGFAVRVYELDRPVKGLLRPTRGKPRIR